MNRLWIKLAYFAAIVCVVWFKANLAVALDIVLHSPAAVRTASESNSSYALVFFASWCPTCQKQQKSLQSLKNDPELADFEVFEVDFDKSDALQEELKVRRQSTIIVYKGSKELSRAVGITQPDEIKKLLLGHKPY